MSKDEVRRSVLKSRLELSAHYIKKASAVICGKFEDMFSYMNVFLFYIPIKNEVDTSLLIGRLFKAGKHIYLPCVEEDGLVFRRFNGFDKTCVGKYGVSEPYGEVLSGRFDAIVIPALAFDATCSRLGYGKGYYDRFLSCVKYGKRIGFAFDFQVVENVYADELDEFMDIIVTDKRIINRS